MHEFVNSAKEYIVIETNSTTLPNLITQDWTKFKNKQKSLHNISIHKYSEYNRRIKHLDRENALSNHLRKKLIQTLKDSNLPHTIKPIKKLIPLKQSQTVIKPHEYENLLPFLITQQSSNQSTTLGTSTEKPKSISTKLSILSLNIGGKLQQKLTTIGFELTRKNPSFILISEHQLTLPQNLAKKSPDYTIPGYTLINWQQAIKQSITGRGSGGLKLV